VIHALALTAAAVSTAALLVVLSLTVFVVSLAFRANRTPEMRPGTRRLEMSKIDEAQPDISAQPASTTETRMRLSGARSK
jgi:hypothetical protein